MPFEYCPQQQAHYFQHPYRRAQPSYCCYQGYFDICKKLFELALKLTIGTKWHKYEGGITVQIRSFLILVVCIFVIEIKKKSRELETCKTTISISRKGFNLRFPQGDIGIQLFDLYSAQETLQKCAGWNTMRLLELPTMNCFLSFSCLLISGGLFDSSSLRMRSNSLIKL